MNISAIVVGYNEADLLSHCLDSIKFCDDINYYDLGSKDKSLEIANSQKINVFQINLEPYVEIIHSKVIPTLKNDWILFIDPDEQISENLAQDIIVLKQNLKSQLKIGSISVPVLYYFKKKPLRGTPWGYNNYRILLANKNRFCFSDKIHSGRQLLNGFENYEIKNNGSNVLHHFWMESYSKLLKKHLRYLKNEGATRFKNGQRATIKSIILSILKNFKYSFYHKKAYLDGITGLFLSIFWVWYQLSAEIELYKFQKKVLKNKN